MNILVCISQVPDTTAKIQVSGDGKSIEKTGIKFILNPYDEFAIEEGATLIRLGSCLFEGLLQP